MEAYAFLAMFTAQILAMSVLHPTLFLRYLRMRIRPADRDRDAQLYIERRLTQYRALNTGVAVLGLLLLGWFFIYVQQPTWDDGPLEALVGLYFLVQILPVCLVSWIVARINKALTLSLPKRTARLQRRGLFDFISPSTIVVAIAVYLLHASLVLYIDRNPFPGFAGAFVNIGIVTLGYAFVALGVYVTLYRTRTNPLETHAQRMRAIEMGVKLAIYTCIGAVVFVALNMTLILLDMQRWEPFGLSAFYVLLALGFTYSARPSASPHHPGADELGSSPVS